MALSREALDELRSGRPARFVDLTGEEHPPDDTRGDDDMPTMPDAPTAPVAPTVDPDSVASVEATGSPARSGGSVADPSMSDRAPTTHATAPEVEQSGALQIADSGTRRPRSPELEPIAQTAARPRLSASTAAEPDSEDQVSTGTGVRDQVSILERQALRHLRAHNEQPTNRRQWYHRRRFRTQLGNAVDRRPRDPTLHRRTHRVGIDPPADTYP
jgi:hypothetical protein